MTFHYSSAYGLYFAVHTMNFRLNLTADGNPINLWTVRNIDDKLWFAKPK